MAQPNDVKNEDITDSCLLFAIRVVLAAVWLYNGLWLKVIAMDAHHLEIMRSVCNNTTMEPEVVLRLIGSCETLLALGILSGILSRFVSLFQIAIVLLMNAIGIVAGGGAIKQPLSLVVSNLPLIACAAVVAVKGPGNVRLRLPGRGKNNE